MRYSRPVLFWVVLFLNILLLGACQSDKQDTSPTVVPTPMPSQTLPLSTTEPSEAAPSQPVDSIPGLQTMNWEIQDAVGVAWSPDGRRIAVASAHSLDIYDATTYAHLIKLEVEGEITSHDVLWSPDSQYIAYGLADGNIPIRHVDTGEGLFVLPGNGYTMGMAWSHDGRWFAAGHDVEDVKLWDLQTGAAPIMVAVGQSHLAFSPDGEHLAGINTGGSRVPAIDVANRRNIWTLEVGPYVSSFAMSPDGNWVMVADAIGETYITLFDVRTGEQVTTFSDKTAQEMYWSPDGRFVVGVKGGYKPDHSILIRSDLSQLVELTSLVNPAIAAAWSPDSSKIVILHQGSAQIAEIALLPEAAELVQSAEDVPTIPSPPLVTSVTLVAPAPMPTPRSASSEDPSPFLGYLPPDALVQLGQGRSHMAVPSPDGTLLAAAGLMGVKVYQTDTFEQRWLARIGDVAVLEWSPDSTMVAVGLTIGDVYVLDGHSGEIIYEMTSH